MSIKIDILPNLNLFLTRASGTIDDLRVFTHQDSIPNMKGFAPTLNTLLDARLVSNNLLSPENLAKLAANTPFDASVKRAYVVSDEKGGMLATLFGSTSSESEHFFVTYNIEDACEWLGFSFEEIKTSLVYQTDM